MDEAKQSIRVVVVDDEPAVADSLSMILRASGYESIATYSAEEALALCQTMNVHVVVSDIVMGPMSGFDLAIWLAEHRPASRIILMSGYSFHDPLVAKSVRRGFDFLRKPIQLDKFLAKIANAGTAPDSPAEPMQETTATEE
jgi:DNA-binding NtrC family response regulator